MNKARAYALGTQGIVVLASLSLWLVSGEVRRAFSGSETGGMSPGMSRERADAQVDSAIRALGEGMIAGDAELALSGCDDGDAEWLEEMRRTYVTGGL